MAKSPRTGRRVILLLIVILVYLAWTNPTPRRFERFVAQRYPVASFFHRRTALELTGGRNFVIFSIYGVQAVDARHHYLGICGVFWEI